MRGTRSPSHRQVRRAWPRVCAPRRVCSVQQREQREGLHKRPGGQGEDDHCKLPRARASAKRAALRRCALLIRGAENVGPRSRCLPTSRTDPQQPGWRGSPAAGIIPTATGASAGRGVGQHGAACFPAGLRGPGWPLVCCCCFTLAAREQDTVDRPERRHDHAAAGEPRRNLRPQGLAARALASTLSAEHSACVLACVRLGERACADAYAHTRAKCATRVRRRWTI